MSNTPSKLAVADLVTPFQKSTDSLPAPQARKPEPPVYIHRRVPSHGFYEDQEFGVQYSGGMAL